MTIRAILRRAAGFVSSMVLVLVMTGSLVGCGALDVSDPTAIEERELEDAAGAELLRGAALKSLFEAVSDGAYLSGLMADEFLVDPPAWVTPGTWPEDLLNRRESMQYEQLNDDRGYRLWQEARRAAAVAIPKLESYAPDRAHVGEMLAARGFAALRLAEDFCPGLPLHDVVDLDPVFGGPLSTEEALAEALADLDSAVALAADSARILDLARVWRGRALLGLGRFEDAAAAVASVPTEFVANAEYSSDFSIGPLNFALAFGNLERSVADQEGGTGLDFVSAEDPRVLVDTLGTAQDGVTGIYRSAKYPHWDAPIVLASGVEARLIEAEADLAGGGSAWLPILNALRTTCPDAATCPDPAPAGSGGVTELPPLIDPGSPTARVDLLFRERAFWLFATGHRLADLRRLVRLYGRAADSVFPTGPYWLGGAYGSGTSIPFVAEKETPFNPAVTGCTSR